MGGIPEPTVRGDASTGATETPAPSAPKRPKPVRGEAFGILNPWGDLWTYRTFESEAWARQYVRDYWRTFPGGCPVGCDPSKYAVIPVKVTVSAK